MKRKQESSPPFSPKRKGLEYVTDRRKAIRRGKIENVLSTPGKGKVPVETPASVSVVDEEVDVSDEDMNEDDDSESASDNGSDA